MYVCRYLGHVHVCVCMYVCTSVDCMKAIFLLVCLAVGTMRARMSYLTDLMHLSSSPTSLSSSLISLSSTLSLLSLLSLPHSLSSLSPHSLSSSLSSSLSPHSSPSSLPGNRIILVPTTARTLVRSWLACTSHSCWWVSVCLCGGQVANLMMVVLLFDGVAKLEESSTPFHQNTATTLPMYQYALQAYCYKPSALSSIMPPVHQEVNST